MVLLTKCILEPKSEQDGVRISVMSRHTLNDGITPHPDITKDSYDEWMPELAPEPRLVGDYYKRGLTWEEFEKAFRESLHEDSRIKIIKGIAIRAMSETITLMCVEASPENCHRRPLAEECQIIEPKIELIIR